MDCPRTRRMLTTFLLVSAVVAGCLAAPPPSDLQPAETKWHGGHGWHGGPGGPGGPGLYRGWGPGAYGNFYPGLNRFDGVYGPGFYGDPLAAFSLGAFPGGVDPWGLGYSGFGPWYY